MWDENPFREWKQEQIKEETWIDRLQNPGDPKLSLYDAVTMAKEAALSTGKDHVVYVTLHHTLEVAALDDYASMPVANRGHVIKSIKPKDGSVIIHPAM